MMKLIHLLSIAALIFIMAMSSFAQEQGLALYMKFDELDGDQIKDHSGMENHGAAFGNYKLAPGKIGDGLKMDGSGANYIEVADADSLDLTEVYTVAVWVNFADIPGTRHQFFFDKGCDDMAPGGWRLGKVMSGNLRFQVYNGGWMPNLDLPAPGFETDKWYHIALTRDDSGKTNIYLDGESGANSDSNSYILPINENALIVWGSTVWGAGNMFTGTMDELVIFKDRALTKEEIGSLMETGAGASAVNAAGKLAVTWGMMKLYSLHYSPTSWTEL